MQPRGKKIATIKKCNRGPAIVVVPAKNCKSSAVPKDSSIAVKLSLELLFWF